MNIIKIDYASPEYDDALRLRYEEILEPLNLDWNLDKIAEESSYLHYGIFDNHLTLLGTLYFNTQNSEIGQIAIKKEAQKRGLARTLLNFIEKEAIDSGLKNISTESIETSAAFFEKMGYKKASKPKKQEGINIIQFQKNLDSDSSL